MENYYVNQNAQSNCDHEVHKEGCHKMPSNRISLGYFSNCHNAVREAKKHYWQSNGCIHCCRECHTS